MRKIFFCMSIIGAILLGCEKDDSEQENGSSPVNESLLVVETNSSAKAADDNKSSGVYKGTFVGSSGSFKLILEIDNIKGILDLDGKGYELTSSNLSNNDLGSAISNASFTDASGIITLTFSVDSDGSNPSVSLTIQGHSNVQVIVAKETSNNQIKIYEGTTTLHETDGCIQHLNLMLKGNDSASVTFKTQGLAPGQTGNYCDDYYTRDDAIYTIKQDSIRVYYIVYEIPGDPSSAMDEDVFSTSNTNGANYSNFAFFSENKISCMSYDDSGSGKKNTSAELIRKL